MNTNKYLLIVACFLSCSFLNTWPPALQNCGQSCFFNVVLQSMYNIYGLTDLLLNPETMNMYKALQEYEKTHSYIPTTIRTLYVQLVKEFKAAQYQSEAKFFSCTKEENNNLWRLYLQMQNVFGDPCPKTEKEKQELEEKLVQQDASEYFKNLFEKLKPNLTKNATLKDNVIGGSEDIENYRKEFLDTWKELFGFKITEQAICPKTDSHERYEGLKKTISFSLWPLTIKYDDKNITNLTECINKFFEKNPVDPLNIAPEGDSPIIRSNCHTDHFIQQLSRYLIINLNRYVFYKEKGGGTTIKLNHSVEIPLSYTFDEKFFKSAPPSQKERTYHLIAAVIQRGVAQGGHYVTYIKELDGQWYLCDDRSIQKINNIDEKRYKKEIDAGYYYIFISEPELEKQIKKAKEQKQQQEALQNLANNLITLNKSLEHLAKNLVDLQPTP